jgi:outer membrane receptor protein involved in Fe transport
LSAQQLQTFSDAGYPCSPGGTVPFYIGRRNVEGGPRFDDLRHTSYRMLGGLRGEIGGSWTYDASANFSRLVFSQTYNNDMSITRIGRALDVVTDPDTGQAACRSALNGVDPSCVPWNVFQEGGVTQDAIDYLTLPLFSQANLNMDQFVGFVTGDLGDYGVTIPTASEGVRVAFGAEYRGESFEFNPDQGFTSGDGAGQGGPTAGVFGSLDVKEMFAELRVPIVQEKPFAESLVLDLRYRYSDYNTGVTADTYNAGGEWTPVRGLMFRGGFSRAVRAANIRELFEPSAFGLWSGADPCAGDAPLLSAEQCANTGVLAGQYGNIPLSPAGQYNGVFAGNEDLNPEKSDSITVGLVFTADQWVPGLTFSIDYWSIEVEDAIDDNSAEFVINQCAVTADPAFCSLINRGPNGNLWVGQANVDLTRVNLGFFDTAGVDIAVGYRLDMGSLGSLGFNYRGTWLDKFDLQVSPQAPVSDCAGAWGSTCERPRPDYKHTFATTWVTPWDLTAVAAWRHVGGVDELSTAAAAFNAGSENYLDLSFTYDPQFGFGDGTKFNVGVQNVLDNDPPVNGRFGNVSVYGNGNTIPGTWDALGRYYFVGLTQNF